MLVLFFVACGSGPVGSAPEVTPPGVDSGVVDTGDSAGGGGETGETGDEPVVVDTTTDVIVVGSGPAGVAAALAAAEAGARVILFERDDTPGTGIRLAGTALAVDTEWQATRGYTDSLELAEAEWLDITGTSGFDASVAAYLENSGPTLEWLVAHGWTVGPPTSPPTEGTVPRSHVFLWDEGVDPFTAVTAGWAGELRTGVEVTAPLYGDEGVLGVRWRNVETGEEGATAAAAVVLASGGFLRDLDAVAAVRPDLVAHDPVFETNPNSVGSTLPFLAAVGAGRYAPDAVGAYLHSVEDPIRPGEALILHGLAHYILVGPDGRRFTSDVDLTAFEPANDAPAGDLWLVSAGGEVARAGLAPPGYNWAVANQPETLTLEDVVAEGSLDVFITGSVEELAAATGLGDGLVDEVADFNLATTSSVVDSFGRLLDPSDTMVGDTWLGLRLRPGLAKNFGGVATDMESHVLDGEGQVIPGLYAAGEVAGMIPGGGSGTGFSGSSSACYYGGRLAGENAAADAAAR